MVICLRSKLHTRIPGNNETKIVQAHLDYFYISYLVNTEYQTVIPFSAYGVFLVHSLL